MESMGKNCQRLGLIQEKNCLCQGKPVKSTRQFSVRGRTFNDWDSYRKGDTFISIHSVLELYVS